MQSAASSKAAARFSTIFETPLSEKGSGEELEDRACVASGASSWGTWPQSSSRWRGARAAPARRACVNAIGTSGSWRPQTNSASGLQLAQPGPEALLAVGLVEVDVARRLVEGDPARAGSGRRAGTRRRRPRTSRRRRPGRGCARSARRSPRGAGWIRPSFGSGARSSQRQRRSRSQASAGLSSTMRPTRSGSEQPDLDRDPAAHAVADEVRALEPERVEQRRRPRRRSRGRRRRRRAACRSRRSRADRSRSRGCPSAPARRRWAGTRPWSRRGRGGRPPARPRPPAERRDRCRACATRLEAQPAGLGGPAGRGEEADAQVQVLADAQSAPRNASIPPRTSRAIRSQVSAVGAQQRVGLAAARRLQLDRRRRRSAPPISPSPSTLEADARRAARHVDHLRVEALDQGNQAGGRTAHLVLFLGLDTLLPPHSIFGIQRVALRRQPGSTR